LPLEKTIYKYKISEMEKKDTSPKTLWKRHEKKFAI